ncbi:FCD domain-containing protein [Arthrobacter sp. 08Y14]|uniref:FCD domain-containing protein n=1 Tax=Arthrobacter sp. 08Y14 TaxID=2058885 RepID=UPI0021579958|nr:FCD domain-containing protein [Arthrobacter sp. 08Y14]
MPPRPTLSVDQRWDDALDEHEALIAAIDRQDVEAARELARAHMETARRIRLKLLREGALEQPLRPYVR